METLPETQNSTPSSLKLEGDDFFFFLVTRVWSIINLFQKVRVNKEFYLEVTYARIDKEEVARIMEAKVMDAQP